MQQWVTQPASYSAIASSGSKSGGRSSYSTLILAAAAAAASGLVAATAATSSLYWRTRSFLSARLSLRKPQRISGTSPPVMTALTPGTSLAADVSMLTMRAFARSEYLILP